jgi:predicted DsbA family dithiol-disulfide isomerase
VPGELSDPTPVRIDVFSDTVCPWCWIGKRRLEKTLAARPDLEARVVWHAFQLNPDMPDGGMDRQHYLASKFGGAERAASIYARIRDEGARESLRFDFDAISRTPNTIDSHRLVRWAATQPPGQDPMVEALFTAYFAEGADVGDHPTLVAAAVTAGFEQGAARDFLAGDAEREAVAQEDWQARNAGISGVPCFIVDGKVAVPGAVEPETFLRILDDYGIGIAS